MKRVVCFAVLAVFAAGCSTEARRTLASNDAQAAGAQVAPNDVSDPESTASPARPMGTSDGGATVTGPRGAAGAAGSSGTQRATAQTGAQGTTTARRVEIPGSPSAAGIAERWASYRVIIFDYAQAVLSAADQSTISEIAANLAKNPFLQVGIDGYRDPSNQLLSEHRIGTVRDALIVAGVPRSKVQIGAFGDPQFRRDRRVEVLLSSESNRSEQNVKSQ